MELALKQISRLQLKKNHPTVICDVDEVICHFISDFILYAEKQNYSINIKNYSLFGNIIHNHTGALLDHDEISILIDQFFASYVTKQVLVEGAAQNLKQISLNCQIIILTNIPHIYADKRRARLKELGLNYPMISSSGPKGFLVKEIAGITGSSIIFIDDIAHHIASVAQEHPEALRLHYIADKTLNKTEPMAEHSHFKCKDWDHIKDIILDYTLDPLLDHSKKS
jgi:hypothetical protein